MKRNQIETLVEKSDNMKKSVEGLWTGRGISNLKTDLLKLKSENQKEKNEKSLVRSWDRPGSLNNPQKRGRERSLRLRDKRPSC